MITPEGPAPRSEEKGPNGTEYVPPSGSPADRGGSRAAVARGGPGRSRSKGHVGGALRLGWQLAEVRGRCRVVVPIDPIEPSLASRQLPLTAAAERTAASSTIEATVILISVAKSLEMDFALSRLVNLTAVDRLMQSAQTQLRTWSPTDKGPGDHSGDRSAGADVVGDPEGGHDGRHEGASEDSAPVHQNPGSPPPDHAPMDVAGAVELLRYLVCLVLFQRADHLCTGPAATDPPSGRTSNDDTAAETVKAKVRIAEALEVDLAVALWAAAGTSASRAQAMNIPVAATTLAAAIADLQTDEPDPSSPTEPPAWKLLQTMMFRWDEAIQDKLAQGTFGDSSAYQLGRGLAESYWALEISSEITAPARAGSWRFLFGESRAATFATLCDRLSGPIDPRTTEAIKFSVNAWKDWVSRAFEAKGSPAIDQQMSVSVDLYNQVMVWRDLLLTGRNPTSYVGPDSLLSALSSPRLLVKSFRAELATAAAGAAALVLAIPDFNGWGAKVVTALGAVGITSSALGATTKKNAQAVGIQLKAAVDQQAINQAVLRPESPPKAQIALLANAVLRGLRGTLRTWFTKRKSALPDSPFERPVNLSSPMARVLPGSQPEPPARPSIPRP